MMDLAMLSIPELEKLWARTENGPFARKVKAEIEDRQGNLSMAGTMPLFGRGENAQRPTSNAQRRMGNGESSGNR